MLAELKDKSQVTIPKAVVKELGLERGDMFDVVVEGNKVILVPVVVYSKDKIAELDDLLAEARAEAASGKAKTHHGAEDHVSDFKTLDEMTPEERNTKLERGYQQSLAGQGRPLEDVFNDLEKAIHA